MVNWLQAKYVSIFEDGLGVMKVYRQGPQGLGMSLDFSHKRQCCVTMYDYLDGILQAFYVAVKEQDDGFVPATKQRFKTPDPDNLFIVNEDCEKLSKAVSADFRTIVAKTLYVTKGARPVTCLAIAFLTMRVRAPNTDEAVPSVGVREGQ